MKSATIAFLSVLIAQCAILPCAVVEGGSISEAKEEFDSGRIEIARNAMDLGRKEARKQIQELFEGSFAGILDDLETRDLSAKNLHTLFSSLNSLVHSTFQREESELMARVVIELYDHSNIREMDLPDDPSPAQRAYDTLINARHYDLATRLEEELDGEIDALPYSFPESGSVGESPSVYAMRDSTRVGTKEIDLHNGEWLVSVVHPSCAFSRRAMTYIESHSSELSDLMPENVLWLSGQSYTYTLPLIENWNKRSATIDIHVSADDESWPDHLILRATPVFYAFNDGKLVGQMIGWTGDNREKELRDFLSDARNAD